MTVRAWRPQRLQLRQSLDTEEQVGFGLRTSTGGFGCWYGAQCSMELESEPNVRNDSHAALSIREEAEA